MDAYAEAEKAGGGGKPGVWIIDSERTPLMKMAEEMTAWADVVYFPGPEAVTDWEALPEAVVVSAEIAGGSGGPAFLRLVDEAGYVPILVVAKLRSLTQAVAYFRAGAADYLTLPVDPGDLRERLNAALDKSEKMALRALLMHIEPVDRDCGEISLSLASPAAAGTPAVSPPPLSSPPDARSVSDDDILAHLPGTIRAEENPVVDHIASADAPLPAASSPVASSPIIQEENVAATGSVVKEESAPLVKASSSGQIVKNRKTFQTLNDVNILDAAGLPDVGLFEQLGSFAKPAVMPGENGADPGTVPAAPAAPVSVALPASPDDDDEPVPVDGLPIPTLWEELPCGLLVFDSAGNLVFANRMGLDLFGYDTLADLQETLENRRTDFSAHGVNNRPLADNQWPQELARKTRTARSAVVSIERPDHRRSWLRIDCLPHLHEGKINRLTMTIVNLTGELPPLAPKTKK